LILNGALDLLFPPHCVACGALGTWLCEGCTAAIVRQPSPSCVHCGRLSNSARCRRCQDIPTRLASVNSYGVYRQPLRKAIYDLKYGGMQVLAEPLAELLANAWVATGYTCDIIMPVPLYKARERQRGYNQSALLGRALSRSLGVPCSCDCLERARNTPPQVGLSRSERHANMADAFRCRHTLVGKRVLLVDDVCTTAATLEACAAALQAAGAGELRGLTLARALVRTHTQ